MVVQIQKCARMANGYGAGFEFMLGSFAEPQQPEKVGHRRPFFSCALRDLFVAQSMMRGKPVEGRRDFNRIKIFTLDVLNQRKFKQAIAINRTNQCWNFCKPGSRAARQRRSPAIIR